MDNNTCMGLVLGGLLIGAVAWVISQQKPEEPVAAGQWGAYPGAGVVLPAHLGARGASWGAYPGVKINLS